MIEWVARHRRSVLFVLIIMVLGGVTSALRLPVGLFPVIDFPRVVVNVEAGDRPVDRMVVEVTRPLEQALRAVPDVAGIRSTSSRGSAELSINFNWGANMVAAQLQLESAINSVVADLPVGTRFTVRRMDPTVFPVLGLTLRSNKRDLVALRDFAFLPLRPLIAAVSGVTQVECSQAVSKPSTRCSCNRPACKRSPHAARRQSGACRQQHRLPLSGGFKTDIICI